MKRLIISILVIIVLCSNVLAQKGSWTIGLTTGLRGEYCFSSDRVRNYWSGQQISKPMAKFYFGYSSIENLQIESGLAYVKNQANYGISTFDWGLNGMAGDQHFLYSSLQLPLHLKYSIPFRQSGFSFFFNAGIDLSIPLQRYHYNHPIRYIAEKHPKFTNEGRDEKYGENLISVESEYTVGIKTPTSSINCLVNAGIGFACQFKCGVGISV